MSLSRLDEESAVKQVQTLTPYFLCEIVTMAQQPWPHHLHYQCHQEVCNWTY